MSLLLPLFVRKPDKCPIRDKCIQERSDRAHSLNLGFMQQGAEGTAAAVLSLQALLCLDPHGARVQPRPELLFYTFHAAVAKTLMQALQQPASVAVVHVGSACTNGTSADADHRGNNAEQQQQQQTVGGSQQQQQQQQGSHWLHARCAWTSAALPVWYVWWHIGLLAYHQQVQQQGQQPHSVRSAAGAAADCTPGSRNNTDNSSSSSSSSSSGSDIMQALYNSPDAR
jgi:hypothetical protein